MRLSDVRCRKPEPLYRNHSTLPSLTGAVTRCSNRLLDYTADHHGAGVPPPWARCERNLRALCSTQASVIGGPTTNPAMNHHQDGKTGATINLRITQ